MANQSIIHYNVGTFMRFILFVSIVQSILFLGHWFLYRTLVRFLGVTAPAKLLTLRVVLGLLSVSFVLTSFLAFRYSNVLVRSLYTTAASWLGIFYLFILASILCWIFYGLGKLFHLPLDQKILIEVLDRDCFAGEPVRIHQCRYGSHYANQHSASSFAGSLERVKRLSG